MKDSILRWIYNQYLKQEMIPTENIISSTFSLDEFYETYIILKEIGIARVQYGKLEIINKNLFFDLLSERDVTVRCINISNLNKCKNCTLKERCLLGRNIL